ncbi:MAG: hypothetical protein LUC85_11310 [Bacteroidales bacterium]|nr:hypothetical protein [Bacteroidales bacterium]MCD8395391.1 hypothetical protein [Bacteroidales bacterium]
MKPLRFIPLALILLALPACSKDDPESNRGNNPGNTENPEIPGNSEATDSIATGYDFTAELLDATTRVQGPRIQLIYGEPGIMASTTVDGTVTLRSIVTGQWATFNDGAPTQDALGPRMDASLEVNGVAMALDTCALEAVTTQGRWWSLVLAGDTTYTSIVITDL